MKWISTLLFLGTFIGIHAQETTQTNTKMDNNTNCNNTEIACQLTPAALQERKAAIYKNVKEQVLQIKELDNGYAFKYPGTDATLDWLMEFIKTERACCSFFVFGLTVAGDQSEIWLELTGPKGTKAFITNELGL